MKLVSFSSFSLRHRVAVLIGLSMAVFELAPLLLAQAPGVPIESLRPANEPLIRQAGLLRESGKLLNDKAIAEQLKTPVPGPVELAKPKSKSLSGREIAERARRGYVRVGWYHLCSRCEHWHLSLSGGYAVAKDAVVTCHHCVEPPAQMREGYYVAVDAEGKVLPVSGVLAKSKTLDAAVLRVTGGNFTPLALNDQVATGDAAYCFSEPLGQQGYFSVGIVNRFYWRGPARETTGSTLEELKALRLNVSTDWAPGSSGAAVLDEFANVIGHVSTISPMTEGRPTATTPPAAERPKASEDKSVADKESPKAAPKEAPKRVAQDRFNGAVLITLHEAVPARGVLALIRGTDTNGPAIKSRGPGKGGFLRR